MAKGIDEKIPALDTDWEGYAKKRVQERIVNEFGSRAGWHVVSDETDEGGYYHILGFASKEAAQEYLGADDKEEDGIKPLLLYDLTIPISAEQGDISLVELSRRGSGAITALDGKVVLGLTLATTLYNPVDKTTSDSGETCTVTVYSRTSSSQPWTQLGEPFTGLYSGDIDLDISGRLQQDVAYQIRAIAVGDDSGKSSAYVQFPSVVKTDVTLTLVTDTAAAQTPANGLQLAFRHTGAVARTLHVRVSDTTGTQWRSTYQTLGAAASGDTPTHVVMTDTAADTVKVTTGGVHRVEAWISVDGTSASTPVLTAMVIMQGAEACIALNSIAEGVVNWGDTVAAVWSSYVPSGIAAPEAVFHLVTEDGSRVLWEQTSVCVSGTASDLHVTPEVDGISGDSIAARLRVYIDGGQTPLYDIPMPIDNTASLAPTAGADFILDPRSRDNATGPERFYNAATGNQVETGLQGMTFGGSDGWVSDSDGSKCLRVPAGASVDIAYTPFEDFSAASGISAPALTMEFDVAVRNIADDTVPVLAVAATQSIGGSDVAVGFTLRPLDGFVMTTGNLVRRNQDIGITEDERVHIAVNILPSLRDGLSVVRIFVDGVNSREFLYTGKSVFASASAATIKIGGEGADIDVYCIRVYRKALGRDDIFADYLASLPDIDSKRALKEANAITDASGRINYDLAKGRYNTLLWRGQYATYGNTKADKFPGTLEIGIVGDPAHSGVITDMTEKGQGTSSMTYYKWNGQFGFKAGESVWTDGNGGEHTDGYVLRDGLPAATKLVAKINYASSPQSHKMGSCNLYDALWKAVTGGNTLTSDNPGRRAAVPQLPFLLFVQDEKDTAPRFDGLATFGPGKGDAPTFGFDEEAYPGYLCLEGADNDMPVLMHRVPWSSDVVLDGEDFTYTGSKQLSVVGGALSEANIAKFRDAFNFVYLHYPDIRPWDGDAASLDLTAAADRSVHYWLDGAGAGLSRYNLMRYDPLEGKWVDAGLKTAGGTWATVNLSTDPVTSGVDLTADSGTVNRRFKEARAAHFKAHIGEYFSVRELLFTMCFCKLIAASDNRGKNTYLYTDPATGLIGFHQDDLDTIFATNNTGQREKPYWVEEHDTADGGGTYWNSSANGLYNAVEEAFDTELRAMMCEILTAMAALAPATDKTAGGCMESYYFGAIKGFPAVAYNETAEIRYEDAAVAILQGKYSNNTHPLTQSLGDSVTAERQWVRSRIDYISSWAEWGKYASSDSLGASGAISFRSMLTVSGTTPDYSVELTAHNAMYPAFAVGQTVGRGTADGSPKRLMAGETAMFSIGKGDGNTNIFIAGADNIRSLGDWTKTSLGQTLTVSSRKLQEFVVDGEGAREFRPTAIVFNAPMLSRLVLRDVATLAGELDLSACPRLRHVDIRGTNVTSVKFPDGSRVEEVRLPSTLTALVLRGASSLKTLTMAGCPTMQTLDLAGTPETHVRAILTKCAADGAALASVDLGTVDWDAVPISIMRTIASAQEASVSGHIALAALTENIPTFADKMRWIALWGDIDSADNALTIDYISSPLTSVVLRGDTMPMMAKKVAFELQPTPSTGNDVSSVQWELEASGGARGVIASTEGARCTVDVLDVAEYASVDEVPSNPPKLTLTVTLTKSDGGSVAASADIACYTRPAVPGDYVFYDGTYAPYLGTKTVVGICFYVNPDDPRRRLCVSPRKLGGYGWGMESSTWDSKDFALSDRTDYNPYCPPGTFNATGQGGSINDSAILNDDGGFRAYPLTHVFSRIGWTTLDTDYSLLLPGAGAGASVPYGQASTLAIVAHRDIVLGDSAVALPTPAVRAQTLPSHDEMEAFTACMAEVRGKYGMNGSEQQIYWPAASACYHWQPTGLKDGETLAECFTRHRWFLPTAAELARLLWHYSKDDGGGHDIFAQARADSAVSLPKDNTWTCDRHNYGSVNDRQATMVTWNNGLRTDIGYRGYEWAVFPVAAF